MLATIRDDTWNVLNMHMWCKEPQHNNGTDLILQEYSNIGTKRVKWIMVKRVKKAPQEFPNIQEKSLSD